MTVMLHGDIYSGPKKNSPLHLNNTFDLFYQHQQVRKSHHHLNIMKTS